MREGDPNMRFTICVLILSLASVGAALAEPGAGAAPATAPASQPATRPAAQILADRIVATQVSFDFKSARFSEVLAQWGKEVGARFIFAPRGPPEVLDTQITASAQDVSLAKLMAQVLAPHRLTYVVRTGYVLVREAKEGEAVTAEPKVELRNPSAVMRP
jgi:hypothetical protein